MDVKICAVRAEGDEQDELQVNAVNDGQGDAAEGGVDTQPPDEAATAACEKGDNDDDVTLELMQQLAEEGEPGQDEVCERSPGYATEESGDIEVRGSSSEDGRVKEKLARWEKWHFKLKEVKKEPVELSSPEEQVRPGNYVATSHVSWDCLKGFLDGTLCRMGSWFTRSQWPHTSTTRVQALEMNGVVD